MKKEICVVTENEWGTYNFKYLKGYDEVVINNLISEALSEIRYALPENYKIEFEIEGVEETEEPIVFTKEGNGWDEDETVEGKLTFVVNVRNAETIKGYLRKKGKTNSSTIPSIYILEV